MLEASDEDIANWLVLIHRKRKYLLPIFFPKQENRIFTKITTLAYAEPLTTGA